MAESATVGELLVILRADITDLQRNMGQATGAITGAASRATPGLRMIQNGMRALAFQAAGVPGPIGRIASGLLMFSVGGGVTLGVVAGLGAIALAWRKLTEHAREAAKAQQEALKTALQSPLRDAQKNLILADQGFAEAVRKRNQLADRPFLAAANPKKYAEDLAGANIKVQMARAATDAWRQKVEELASAFEELLDVVEKVGMVERLTVPGLNEGKFGPQVIGTSLREVVKGINQRRVGVDKDAVLAADRFIVDFGKRFRERYEAMRLIGESIGQALADGINQVMAGGNFFKSFFRTLLGIGINVGTSLIGGAITKGLMGKGGVPGLSGGGAPGFFGKVAAPIGMVDFSTFPAATNPLADARDAQWQRFFRESGLVARTQGYR